MENTKKMQFEMKEVAEAIDRGLAKSRNNLSEALSSGVRSMPVLAGVPLGRLYIPLDAEDTKLFFKECEANNKKMKKLGVKEPSLGFMPVGMGASRREIELHLVASYGETDYSIDNGTSGYGFGSNFLEIVQSAGGDSAKLLDLFDDNTPEAARRKYIRDKAEVFMMTHFGLYWKLTVISKYDTSKYLSNHIDDIYEAVDKLIDIHSEKYKTKQPEVYVKYERFAPAVAVNIIKLIEKSSDTEDNAYTGKCKGITFEALVIDAENKKHGGARILKSFNTVMNSPSFNTGMNEMLMDNKLRVANLDAAFASDYAVKRLYVIDGIDEYEKSLEADKKFKEDPKNLTGELMGEIRNREYMAGTVKFSDHTGLNTVVPFMLDNELIHLVLPYNKDYSNSFKAKYI